MHLLRLCAALTFLIGSPHNYSFTLFRICQCYRKLSYPISDFASRTAQAYASCCNGFLQLSFCVSLVDGYTLSRCYVFVNTFLRVFLLVITVCEICIIDYVSRCYVLYNLTRKIKESVVLLKRKEMHGMMEYYSKRSLE